MLIKRRDNRLFSQTTPGSFRRPDCFASDFGRGQPGLVNSLRRGDDPAGRISSDLTQGYRIHAFTSQTKCVEGGKKIKYKHIIDAFAYDDTLTTREQKC